MPSGLDRIMNATYPRHRLTVAPIPATRARESWPDSWLTADEARGARNS